jgi:hypothetical protein
MESALRRAPKAVLDKPPASGPSLIAAFARGIGVTHRYGRVVGRIHVGNVDVNAELIRKGAAWVYRDYPGYLTVRGASAPGI